MSSNPVIFANKTPAWQPHFNRRFYCIQCSHLMAEGEGPLVCNRCAKFVGTLAHFCNLCGKPMPLHSGANVAHEDCYRQRYMVQNL